MKNKVSKKIRLIILAKSVDGGTGTYLQNLLNLKKLFDYQEIKIKALVLEKPSYRKLFDFKALFLRNKSFYPEKYSLSIKNIRNYVEDLCWFKKEINKFKPNIILSIDFRSNSLAILLKMYFLKNIKVIATNHIDLVNTIFNKSTISVNFLSRQFIGYFYNKVDVLVSVSKKLSVDLLSEFNLKCKMITIYNGIDIKFRQNNFINKNNKKIIITVGRLVEQKDNINLIKAFNGVHNKFSNVELWILGEGPERKDLERYIIKHKLSNKVKLLGWKADIGYFLKQAYIFVLSSKREGFPYVLIEAMSYGIPIVSTDTPYGPSEALDNGKYGILVPMGDSISMKNAIIEILMNKEKREYFSKKSLERTEYFSVAKMLTSYKNILTDLIK